MPVHPGKRVCVCVCGGGGGGGRGGGGVRKISDGREGEEKEMTVGIGRHHYQRMSKILNLLKSR